MTRKSKHTEHEFSATFPTCFCGEPNADYHVDPEPTPAVPVDTTGQGHDGSDIVPERDEIRLVGQLKRIWDVMIDGNWRSLHDIASTTGDPEASISAQLRHLRKPRMGGHTIDREHQGDGLWLYRLTPLVRP
jgi:hypothetical protein